MVAVPPVRADLGGACPTGGVKKRTPSSQAGGAARAAPPPPQGGGGGGVRLVRLAAEQLVARAARAAGAARWGPCRAGGAVRSRALGQGGAACKPTSPGNGGRMSGWQSLEGKSWMLGSSACGSPPVGERGSTGTSSPSLRSALAPTER